MLKKNRGLTIIITIYFVGVLSAFLFVKPTTLTLLNHDISFWGVIKTFCLNYWYIFVMWVLGLSLLGVFINIFIIYFRGFIYGVLVVHLIKTNLKYLLAITIVEMILFLPMFLVLSYFSVMMSYHYYKNINIKNVNYQKLNLVAIVIILIYSIFLEVIGGLYA